MCSLGALIYTIKVLTTVYMACLKTSIVSQTKEQWDMQMLSCNKEKQNNTFLSSTGLRGYKVKKMTTQNTSSLTGIIVFLLKLHLILKFYYTQIIKYSTQRRNLFHIKEVRISECIKIVWHETFSIKCI